MFSRKLNFTFCVTGLCFSHILWAAEPGKTRVSLDEAKRYAASQNHEIQAMRHALEAAEQEKNRAGSAFYPEFGIVGGVESQNSPEKTETATIGYAYGKINVFRGFSDSSKLEIAGLKTDVAREKLRQKEFQIGLNVERYFHTYVYYKRLLTLNQEALATNNKNLGTVKRRRSSGQVSDADVMEFSLRDSLIRSEIVSLENSLEEARVNLKKLLGEEIGSKVEPSGQLRHEHIVGHLNDYLTQVKDNEEILVGTKELAIASAERKISTAKWLPEIDFEIQSGLLPLDKSGGSGQTTNLLLVGRLPLFSGLESLYDRREKLAKQESQSEKLKSQILNGISEVEMRYRRLRSIEKRVDLEFENTSMAQRYYNGVSSEYSRGVKNSADLKSAAENFLAAQTREEKYKFDFLIERLELEKILCRTIQTEALHDHHSKTKAGKNHD